MTYTLFRRIRSSESETIEILRNFYITYNILSGANLFNLWRNSQLNSVLKSANLQFMYS